MNTMRRFLRVAPLGLLAVAGCRVGRDARDDSYAVGTYQLHSVNAKTLPTGIDVRLAVLVSGSTTLNPNHTFSDRESIRIDGGATADWRSSGTWTIDGDKLVKVHNTPAGPVTELAMLFGDTIEAGRSVLVRR